MNEQTSYLHLCCFMAFVLKCYRVAVDTALSWSSVLRIFTCYDSSPNKLFVITAHCSIPRSKYSRTYLLMPYPETFELTRKCSLYSKNLLLTTQTICLTMTWYRAKRSQVCSSDTSSHLLTPHSDTLCLSFTGWQVNTINIPQQDSEAWFCIPKPKGLFPQWMK
jgi:hypothetical protein